MDKIKVDAVITDLEIKVEVPNSDSGSYVNFRFIDTFPHFTKVNEMIAELEKRSDVDLIDYEYTYTKVNSKTNLKYYDVTIN